MKQRNKSICIAIMVALSPSDEYGYTNLLIAANS